MATLSSLDQLARFAPQIFGRALSMDGVLGTLLASSGRHDHIDRHTYEMREALTALRLLSELCRTDKVSAQVMAYAHVVCGEEARRRPDTWLMLAQDLTPPTRARKSPLTEERRTGLIQVGFALYLAARARWLALT